MKEAIVTLQIATLFVGSIVGAGLSSGRELNQFFSVYGVKSIAGLFICGLLYILFGKIIIKISTEHKVSSYNEFVDLVCPKYINTFVNLTLTLFLISSTSIIMAGSSSLIRQYFGLPKWVGFVLMVGCSILFLLRNTEGLFEINSLVVPTLIVVLTSIFVLFCYRYPSACSIPSLLMIPNQKDHWEVSAIVYASFNILSIIGVIVPLANEMKSPKVIMRGIGIGSVILTVLSLFITILMIANPFTPSLYEIPLLSVARSVSRVLGVGMLMVMWLEMFSSQISNVYSLAKSMENKFGILYNRSIFIIIAIAFPFSFFGFAHLVEVLYPIYGVLSLVFLASCTLFYFNNK